MISLDAQNDTVYPADTLVDPALFSSANILVNWTLGYCPIYTTGPDTTFAPCYSVTYEDHWETSIELCPPNLDSVGGYGLHLGDPWLLDSNLFIQMELDGSNIINDTNNYWVNYQNLTSGVVINAGGPTMMSDYCIEADLFLGTTNTWFQSFEILVGPIFQGMPIPYGTAAPYGLLKNGIVVEGTPPSSEGMAAGGGVVPVDYCGWHPEPAGFGHFHAIPTGIDTAIAASGYDASRYCAEIPQENGYGLAGFTFEGIPLYGPKDDDGTFPTGLDVCNGHTGPTPEFPGGVYHYHAESDDIINNPPCRKGYICMDNSFTYGEWTLTGNAPTIENENLIEIYPNPSQAFIQIVGEHQAFMIYDLKGAVVYTHEGKNTTSMTQVDVSEFENGVYILTAEMGDHFVFKKFIVNK